MTEKIISDKMNSTNPNIFIIFYKFFDFDLFTFDRS